MMSGMRIFTVDTFHIHYFKHFINVYTIQYATRLSGATSWGYVRIDTK